MRHPLLARPTLLLLACSAIGVSGSWLHPAPLGLALIIAAYALALWSLRRSEASLVAVLLLGAAIHLPLALRPPSSSTDLYRYLWEGRMLAAGENPFRFPPSSPRFESLRDAAVYPQINHPRIATIYPPVAQGLFVLSDFLGGTPRSWKLLLLALEIGAAVALARRRGQGAALAFLWNPLLICESADGGHVDAAGAAILLIALVALQERKLFRATLSWWATVLVKPLPLLITPFLIRQRIGVLRLVIVGLLLGSTWGIAFSLPDGSLTPRAPLQSLGFDGSAPPPREYRAESQLRLSHPRLGLGPCAADGRGALFSSPEHGVVGVIERAARSQGQIGAERRAEELIGRFYLGALRSKSTLLHLEFDASESLRILDGGRSTWSDPLGYYVDDSGEFVIWQRTSGEELARLELSVDGQVLRGRAIDEDHVDREALGLKGAENPFMGFSQYRGRWSGRSWLHPLLQRLGGSRRGGQGLAALLLLLLAAVCWWKRAPASGALVILGGVAVACLPVIYPWYFLWLLPGLCVLRQPALALVLAPLLFL